MDGIAGVYGVKDPELVNKAFLATAACRTGARRAQDSPSEPGRAFMFTKALEGSPMW